MDTMLPVIYRDRYLLAINKPPGLVCHPSGQYQGDTVITRVRCCLTKQARLVHRLDQNTSGVMVIALDPAVVPALYRQFEKRRVKKTYLALVGGRVEHDGEIDFPLAPVSPLESVIKIKEKIAATGNKSKTAYRVLASSATTSLLEVTPHTGRKHQIRLHLAAIGHPVVNDLLYRRGGLPFLWEYYCCRSFAPQILRGHGLHARYLEITHPVSENIIGFSATMPAEWRKYDEALKRPLQTAVIANSCSQ